MISTNRVMAVLTRKHDDTQTKRLSRRVTDAGPGPVSAGQKGSHCLDPKVQRNTLLSRVPGISEEC